VIWNLLCELVLLCFPVKLLLQSGDYVRNHSCLNKSIIRKMWWLLELHYVWHYMEIQCFPRVSSCVDFSPLYLWC